MRVRTLGAERDICLGEGLLRKFQVSSFRFQELAGCAIAILLSRLFGLFGFGQVF